MNKTELERLARLIRFLILTMTTRAGSGHPTSSLSAVELMTVLFFKYLRCDLSDPNNPANDRVIFSKGHASPLYYALYAAAGAISEKDVEGYRTFNSVLEGHPTGRFKYTEAATGSLGQGLSVGLGEAMAGVPRVFVLCGDGELAEGSMWEAAAAASYRNVDNLVLMVDINRLGQSDPTMYEYNIEVYKKRFEAFGWRVVVIEKGNDLEAVDRGLKKALDGRGPTVILAKTVKGKGVSFLEDASGWHGKALSKDELPKALAELGDVDVGFRGKVEKPMSMRVKNIKSMNASKTKVPVYPTDKPVATRKAFGNALARLGGDPRLVVFDGDVKNSSYTEFFAAKFPERFFEMYIAEQNMVGVATGFAARGYLPVVSSFACFLTRAADQLRMAAFSGVTMLVNGSHAGVSIGQDGPSQMGLEDLSQFRAIHGSTVLYPGDAISAERLVEQALKQKGITYIRTTRSETPILYGAKEQFFIGGSKVHHASNVSKASKVKKVKTSDTSDASDTHEAVTIVAAGITLHEALKAQQELAKDGIGIRVIDCYSVKPIDQKTLEKAAKETKAIIVVEDHYPEGGLGEAVRSAVSSHKTSPIIHLAVTKTPRSGKPAELLAYEEIDANAIIKTIKNISK